MIKQMGRIFHCLSFEKGGVGGYPKTGRYQLADGFRSFFKGSLVADGDIMALI